MRVVQFDEDLDARHLVRACSNEGLVTAFRFPAELRNRSTKDADVLETLLPKGNLLLTTDLRLVEDHLKHVPSMHPGIVEINQDSDQIATMTTHAAQKILTGFKADMTGWHELPWRNSIIRIAPSSIDVRHVARGVLRRDIFLLRSVQGWQDRFQAALEANDQRSDLDEAT